MHYLVNNITVPYEYIEGYIFLMKRDNTKVWFKNKIINRMNVLHQIEYSGIPFKGNTK